MSVKVSIPKKDWQRIIEKIKRLEARIEKWLEIEKDPAK